MAEAGLVGHEGKVFVANFLAHVVVTLGAYLFWLWRLNPEAERTATATADHRAAMEGRHVLTLAVVAVWTVGVVAFRLPAGATALVAAAFLLAMRAGDEGAALKGLPWGALVMVCGVATLVSLVEKTGGIDLMGALIARFSTPASVNGVVAFVTGVISTWSSTSGVVLPAFLPTVPSLVARLAEATLSPCP